MDKQAQERVLIAKDALAWIEAGALIPTNGAYVVPENNPNSCNPDMNNIQLRDFNLGKCKVCALGAIFLAKAVRYNNVLANQLYLSSRCYNSPLNDHFSHDQLILIERTFEGWMSYEFYVRYPDPQDRLIAILKNIIKHKGTFRPEFAKE